MAAKLAADHRRGWRTNAFLRGTPFLPLLRDPVATSWRLRALRSEPQGGRLSYPLYGGVKRIELGETSEASDPSTKVFLLVRAAVCQIFAAPGQAARVRGPRGGRQYRV